MATRLEKAQAILKREERKADLRRLKQARDHLQVAAEFLKTPLHDQKFENYASGMRPTISEFTQKLNHLIEAGT